MFFFDTSVSRLYDICIPTWYGLNSWCVYMKASFSVNFERFTVGRLSYIPGIVKLLESPDFSRGFTLKKLIRFSASCISWAKSGKSSRIKSKAPGKYLSSRSFMASLKVSTKGLSGGFLWEGTTLPKGNYLPGINQGFRFVGGKIHHRPRLKTNYPLRGLNLESIGYLKNHKTPHLFSYPVVQKHHTGGPLGPAPLSRLSNHYPGNRITLFYQ